MLNFKMGEPVAVGAPPDCYGASRRRKTIMEFKTKFNLDDHVWYMKGNKVVEVVISAIEIFFVGTSQDRIKYNARNISDSVSWLDHQNLFENMLFSSKEELLKSL